MQSLFVQKMLIDGSEAVSEDKIGLEFTAGGLGEIMNALRSVYVAAVWGVGLAVSSTAANAVVCPPTGTAGADRHYSIEATGGAPAVLGCAWGADNNITQMDQTDPIVGVVGTYPAATGANIIPAGYNLLIWENTTNGAAALNPNAYVDFDGTLEGGTLKFLANLTNVLIALKDGGDPKYAVFSIASVSTNNTYDWDISPQGSLSHYLLWGTTNPCPDPPCTPTQVPGPVLGAGLPALLLACGGLIALARRRRAA